MRMRSLEVNDENVNPLPLTVNQKMKPNNKISVHKHHAQPLA